MHLKKCDGVLVCQQDRDQMVRDALNSVRRGEDYSVHATGNAVVMAYRCGREIVVLDANLQREGREEE